MKVVLGERADSFSHSPVPTHDEVLLVESTSEISDWPALLAGLQTGAVQVAGNRLRIHTQNSGGRLDFHVFPYGIGDVAGHAVSLRSQSASLPHSYPEIAMIEAGLRSGRVPYDGLNDLRRSYCGIGSDSFNENACAIEASAPVPVTIEDCTIKGKHLQIRTSHREGSSGSVTLGIIAHLADGTLLRERREVTERENEVLLSAPASLVIILAHYNGVLIARRSVVPPGVQSPGDLVKHLFGSVDSFLTSLRDVEKSDRHEHLVALLLSWLGYVPINLTHIDKDEADLICFHPRSQFILTVECTTGPLDNKEKIAKLLKRTHSLRESLGKPVVPMFVTSLKDSEVLKTHWETAIREGLAVLTHSRAERIVAGLRSGQNVDVNELVEELRRRPTTPL